MTTAATLEPRASRRQNWQFISHQGGKQVLVTDENGDRFTLRVEDVIRACRSAEKFVEFTNQISDLLDRLAAWLSERTDKVDRAYLSLETDCVAFTVVLKAKGFDPDFEDALSAIDLEIAQDQGLNLIHLRSLVLPLSSDTTVSSFLTHENGWVAKFEQGGEMSSMAEHIDLCNRNQAIIDYTLGDASVCAEAIAVMAFYKALHIMEAMFDRNNGRHHTSHTDRDKYIRGSRQYSSFWNYYRTLQAASLVARYLSNVNGVGYANFSDYLPPADIKPKLLDRYLAPLEKMAVQLLSANHGLNLYKP